MPNYRIPNNSNDDANGIWTPNQIQRAKEGGEWPDPWTPGQADGWVSRCTALTGGSSLGNSYFNHWGGFGMNQYYCNYISMRCTSHDWTLQALTIGDGPSNGYNYVQFGIWAGTQVQGNNSAGAVQWSGNNSYYFNSGGSSGGAYRSNQYFIGAGGGAGTAVLTQNTWYAVGGAYWSNGTTMYTAYNGGGYTNYWNSTSQTLTGTATLTGTFEWAVASTDGQGYFSNTQTLGGNTTQGPFGAFRVVLYQ